MKKYPNIYVMTFIYKPKKNRVYNKFMNYIVTSGYIKKYIVLSESEIKYYSELLHISPDNFHPTRIGVADIANTVVREDKTEKYYLSVGRSNRDYHFLRDAWDPKYGKLIIISDSYNESEKAGITCLKNCYGDDYIAKLANCYAQIIPLDNPNIASGSLSFLQAMMLCKPIIVTENKTVYDYINNKNNGLIIQKTEQDLRDAICYLENEENYNYICRNARRDYEKSFSEYSLGIDIGKMLKGENKKI